MTTTASIASNSTTPVLPPVSPETIVSEGTRLFHAATGWLEGHWPQVLLATALAGVIAAVLFWARGVARRRCEKGGTGGYWGMVAGRTIARTGRAFIIALSAFIVTRIADAPAPIDHAVSVIFTIVGVFQGAIWAREIILGAIEQRTRTEDYSGEALMSAMGIIRVLVTFAAFAIALIVVLDNLGANVTGLVAGLGVGGIAIGLAAQGIFADLFAALAIIFDRPFRQGDVIAYDQSSGTVEAIGLKSTRIRAATGEQRVIANKQLLDKEIQNISRRDHRRGKFIIAIARETADEKLAALPGIITQAISEAGMVPVQAGFATFGASSHDFEVEFDSPGADFAPFFEGRHQAGLAIIAALRAHGIALAYPVQTAFTAAPDGRLVMPYPAPAS